MLSAIHAAGAVEVPQDSCLLKDPVAIGTPQNSCTGGEAASCNVASGIWWHIYSVFLMIVGAKNEAQM